MRISLALLQETTSLAPRGVNLFTFFFMFTECCVEHKTELDVWIGMMHCHIVTAKFIRFRFLSVNPWLINSDHSVYEIPELLLFRLHHLEQEHFFQSLCQICSLNGMYRTSAYSHIVCILSNGDATILHDQNLYLVNYFVILAGLRI